MPIVIGLTLLVLRFARLQLAVEGPCHEHADGKVDQEQPPRHMLEVVHMRPDDRTHGNQRGPVLPGERDLVVLVQVLDAVAQREAGSHDGEEAGDAYVDQQRHGRPLEHASEHGPEDDDDRRRSEEAGTTTIADDRREADGRHHIVAFLDAIAEVVHLQHGVRRFAHGRSHHGTEDDRCLRGTLATHEYGEALLERTEEGRQVVHQVAGRAHDAQQRAGHRKHVVPVLPFQVEQLTVHDECRQAVDGHNEQQGLF